MVPLSKSGVRKHRGFESRPLRHTLPDLTVLGGVRASAPRLRTFGCARSGARTRPCQEPPSRGASCQLAIVLLAALASTARAGGQGRPRVALTIRRSPGRGRLVDYGAALEMRFGATRRGFESRPLRQLPGLSRPVGALASALYHSRTFGCARSGARTLPSHRPSSRAAEVRCQHDVPPDERRAGVDFASRARRGTSGALYLQSAPAGLNPPPRSPSSNAARRCDVEDRVPRSGEPRTVSDPEGSSTKRSSPSAAARPGPSRPSRWARGRSGRRRVHGTLTPLALDQRRR